MFFHFRIIAILFFVFISHSSFSVNQHWIDSITKVTNGNAPDSVRIEAYAKLSVAFLYSDPVNALLIGKKGLEFALKGSSKKSIGQMQSTVGNVYYTRGEYDEAIKYYELSEKNFSKANNLKGSATSLNNIGLVYINQGDYAKGLDYQFKSLKIREQIGDSQGIAYNYNAIAVVYLQKGDQKNALEFQQRSLEMNEHLHNARGVMTNESNIGNIYFEMKVFDKALEFQLKSLKKAQDIHDVNGMANATGNLANVFAKQKLFDKALDYYERSIGYQQAMDDKAGMCSNFNSEADVYKEKKEYAKSIELYLKAIQIAKEVGARDILKIAYRGIAEAYSVSGNFQEAYKYLFNYSDLKDTITEQDAKRNIAEMQARFDNETKEKKITLLEQQKQIDQLKGNRQQNIIYFSVIGLVLVLILALVIFNRYRIKQKANVQLEQAYHIIEDKNKDITASINYARRIQQSLLPTEKYIHRNLERLRKKLW